MLITELDMDVLPRDPDMWGADLSKKAAIKAKTNIYPDGLPAAMQQKLAKRYADVFALVLKHGVARVTFWGVTDATSWLHDFPIPGRVNYPLLWDRDGREKPAFAAVAEVLRRHGGRPRTYLEAPRRVELGAPRTADGGGARRLRLRPAARDPGLHFRNVHSYSNSTVAFDATVFDGGPGVELRQRELAWLDVSGAAPPPAAAPPSRVLEPGAAVERLAGGFHDISGGAVLPPATSTSSTHTGYRRVILNMKPDPAPTRP